MKLVVSLLLIGSVCAQVPGPQTSAINRFNWSVPKTGGLTTGYRTPPVAPVQLEDSGRLHQLLREGEIYLSLQDAIALALENNLDMELERYGLRLADTDVLRSKSGALPRGIPLSVRETPSGLGTPVPGPNGTLGGGNTPTLNNLIGPGVQIDLSILGSLPLPTGTVLPNFDPQIVGNVGWNHVSNPQNSTFLTGFRSLNSNTTNANVAYQQGFTTGGSLQVFFNNARQRFDNPLLSYNPNVASSVGLAFTQPLLRGFGFGVNRRYLRIAKNNRGVSDLVFQQQVIATVSGIIRLYWDLVSLNEDVRVRQDAVTSAERLLRDTQNQMQTGTAAQIDVTRARSELSRRQRDLAVSRSLARQQETVLKDYITRSQLDSTTAAASIVPTDRMSIPAQDNFQSVDRLMEEALRLRPDVAQARLQMTNSEINLAGSKSELRPAFDLVANAQNNGLAGEPNRFALQPTGIEPFLLGGYSDALTQIVQNNFPSYGVGVQLTIPLRNRAARADVLRDELSVRQQQIRIRQLEKQIRLEITNALIALEQARATYEANKNERALQEETLAAEQEKLEVGASTNFFIVQYQRDLAAAKSAEVSSLADYQKAKTALQRFTGTILSDYHIQIDEAVGGEIRRLSAPEPTKP